MKQNLLLKFLVLFSLIFFSFYVNAFPQAYNFDNYSFETGDFSNWDTNSNNVGTQGNISVFEVNTNSASQGNYSADSKIDIATGGSGGNMGGAVVFQNSLDYNLTVGDNIKFDIYINDQASLGGVKRCIVYKTLNGNFYTPREGDSCAEVSDLTYCEENTDSSNIDYLYEQTGSWNTKEFTIPSCISTTDGGIDNSYPIRFYFKYIVTCGGSCTADSTEFYLDNFRFERDITPTIVNTLREPLSNVDTGQQFTARVQVAYDSNSENVSNADVNFNFNNEGYVTASYSSVNQWYEYTFTAPLTTGDYNLAVLSTLTGATGDYDEYSVTVVRSEYQYLTITTIENIASWSYGSVDFIPSNDGETIIWQVDNNSASAETPEYKITNDNTDGRQYFIYTSATNSNYAFDDTLTFGSAVDTPIQKIWNDETEEYEYSFSDTLSAGETKYYKLTYKYPYKYYNSISGSTDWQISLVPNVIDYNVLSYDEYTISQYANIRNTFVEPIPDITEDETSAFELQFTAWSDVNGTTICAGETVYNTDTTTCGTLTSTPKRFSFTISESDFDSQALMLTTNNTSAVVNIMDYSIVARGYFTKRLEQLKANGDVLDSFLLNGLSTQYLQEGQPFKIKTEVYDREGKLDRFELEGYFGDTTANNLVRKTTQFPYDTDDDEDDNEETTLSFDELFPPIIDLNGSTGNPVNPRLLILKANVYDNNGVHVATQSQSVRFLQYPYFPDDLIINFFPTEKRKGKNPKGLLELKVKYPSTLTGLDFRLWDDTNSVSSPDYKTRIYKGNEFDCTSSNCSFEILIDDWLFEDVNRNSIQITAMLNTEYFSLTNALTHVLRHVWVTPIEFNIGKIHQVVERPSNAYRNDEEIPLVMVLQDDEATNISDKIDVYLTLKNCDSNAGSPNCVDQTTQYPPTGFIYDDQFNLNYYFFRHLFVMDDGSLLPDGNYISFDATITDRTGVRTTQNPILASKCQGKDWIASLQDAFFSGIASIVGLADVYDSFASYCNTPQYDLVTTTTNTSEREYLRIDATRSNSSPTQEALLCLTPDSNNILSKPFEQNLICFVSYTIAEKPIDSFRLRLTNNFSNLKETGSTKQYLEFNVPYEVIAYNDVELLKAEIETNQDTEIDTVGDFLFYGFRNAVVSNYKLWGLEDASNFVLGNGLIENVGGQVDLTADFNSANLPAGVFFIVKGIPVLNVQSYKNDSRLSEEFERIDRSNFLNYLAENNISYKEGNGELEFITSSFASPYKLKSDGVLIIDAQAQDIKVNRSNVDQNTTINYNVMPQTFLFNLSNTMFYNNFSENDTLTTLIRVVSVIKKPPIEAFTDFFDEFGSDPMGAITSVLFDSIVPLSILMGLLLVFAIIYSKFKPNGGGNE